MKKKTIVKVLNNKFEEFAKSITDLRVQKLVRANSIITGGCIASMLLKEKVNDFDIYFTNKETVKAVAEYYCNIWNLTHPESNDGFVADGAEIDDIGRMDGEFMGGVGLNLTSDRIKIIFKSKGVVKEEGAIDDDTELEEWPDGKPVVDEESKPKYRPIYISANAVTLSQKIQIILRFYGDPDDIHQHYDYMHCTNYWLSKTKELTLKQPALECLLSKELVYVGSKYPIASIIRLRKFINRGWTINAGQILKMSWQISELDLTNIAVLEDQLTGVDVAYFNTLIDALQTKIQKDSNFKLDYSYLVSIIDKIF